MTDAAKVLCKETFQSGVVFEGSFFVCSETMYVSIKFSYKKKTLAKFHILLLILSNLLRAVLRTLYRLLLSIERW